MSGVGLIVYGRDNDEQPKMEIPLKKEQSSNMVSSDGAKRFFFATMDGRSGEAWSQILIQIANLLAC